MDQEKPKFDWIGWLATIPGIPADWGTNMVDEATSAPPEDDAPLPLAA
ncbi:MAG: hypothetical protein ACK442_07695 [Novosphingobium sp.]|jgi:hypothetical protein|nr:hypothetical protein [Novosphingobium sp.]